MSTYIQVAEDGSKEAMEVPTEDDGSLLLSTLAGQFPTVSGLKFLNPNSGGMRGVRLVDGKFHLPENSGKTPQVYYCVFPKAENNKRKSNGDDESENSTKVARLDSKAKCSDLIVLGLPWRTGEDELRQCFEPFGELVIAQVKRDVRTGQSKGFGFIQFANIESQAKALSQRHMIQGRWCDVKIPNSKDATQQQAPTKIFVGRCTEDMSVHDLRQYFSQYGQVTDVYIPKPFRAFAFVTFLEAAVATRLCGEVHVIKGISVHVSNAAPKSGSKRY